MHNKKEMTIHMTENKSIPKEQHKEKYSDAQKAKFMVEEATARRLLGRADDTLISCGDYLWNMYPKNYINICNKYFGGTVKVASVN
jgi:hypothetical protein